MSFSHLLGDAPLQLLWRGLFRDSCLLRCQSNRKGNASRRTTHIL